MQASYLPLVLGDHLQTGMAGFGEPQVFCEGGLKGYKAVLEWPTFLWWTQIDRGNCAECFQNDLWMEKTDFGRVGANARSDSATIRSWKKGPGQAIRIGAKETTND